MAPLLAGNPAANGTMRHLGTGDLATVTSTIPGATSLAGVVDYAYDRKRQLTLEDSDRSGGYDFANAFDGAGNATTFRDGAQTFNADNQLTGTGYVYDGNGNPTAFGGTTLAFDVENRLTAYGTALTAGYRGDSLRAWKETTAGRTYFLYDGIRIVGELDADGDLIAGSTYGAAGLLSRGTTQYQFDPLGDAVLLLDGSGAVTANRLFDAWGNELTAVAEPYGYNGQVGQYTDAENACITLPGRTHSVPHGRFLQRDPIRYLGGTNLYALVANQVTSSYDPTGTHRKPGVRPPNRWPKPPSKVDGRPYDWEWNKEGYYEDRGTKVHWDDHSHGSGADRGDGEQEGHWDVDKASKRSLPGGARRMRRDGTMLCEAGALPALASIPDWLLAVGAVIVVIGGIVVIIVSDGAALPVVGLL